MARSILYASAALCAVIAIPAQADVKEGVDAWSAGDYQRAVSEWNGPAEAGNADALFNLAQAYRLGRGVTADIRRARELYAQAADAGHVKAADNYGLLLFQQGEREAAMPLIKSAAERGDPRAQYVLGLSHFNADHAEKDWTRAYAFITLAHSAGLPQAASARAQMDEYISAQTRETAQTLARQIENSANQRRAADLAAAELALRSRPTSDLGVKVAALPAAPAAPSMFATTSASIPAAASPVAYSKPAPNPAPKPAGKNVSEWRVQLGAFAVDGNAERLWAKLSGNYALAGTSRKLIPTGRVTRLQAYGFESLDAAKTACAALKREGQTCLVTNK
ncbi:SPOR domain-containing protein [Erythrobacter sp. MTPC3]|uniref:SPOR domain-containing protein n=1 Tax=Erythrobacter sp. MTPC3 TaxID=3056564 RepID=UPI0036F1D4E5